MLPAMSSAPRHEKVDEIMERAEAALRRSQWFEAERLARMPWLATRDVV